MNENIDELKYHQIEGTYPEYELMQKINELISEMNVLKNRVKELENTKNGGEIS